MSSLLKKLSWQHQQPLFIPCVALLMLGTLMVSSASMGIAEFYTGNPLYFATRQIIYMLLGLATLYVVSLIPLKVWKKYDAILLVFGVIALILVFFPGIGHEVNGSRRWLNLGIIKVQASEIAKLACVLYVSGYLVRRQDEVTQSWAGFFKPLVIMLFILVLLLLEPDFGAASVLLGAVMIQLFLGGVKAGQYFLLLFGALISGVITLSFASYRVARLMSYRDPWAPEHVYGIGYQLTQSLIAFGRGDLFGVGLGESIQKLFYLPEAHTDFVFAIWAEETGLFGALISLMLLAWLLVRIWQTSWQSQLRGHMYAAYASAGIASLFGLQILINVGVNTGLLPTKGLTLPFYSYGGSSLLICCGMVAIVMRIALENQQKDAEKDSSKEGKYAAA